MGRTPGEFDGYPEHLRGGAPFGPYRAVIIGVTDGDTVVVIIDPGFNLYPCHAIRLDGIEAPELFTGPPETRTLGAAAKAFVVELIGRVGPHCVIQARKQAQSFGRYVATITLADGTDLGRAVIDAGHAVRRP